MDVRIHGTNLNITEEMEEFTRRRIERLGRYLPNIRTITVEFSHHNSKRGPDIVSAQITVHHERGAILRAEEKLEKDSRETVKSALNGAIDKMYRRITRFKGKRDSKRLREVYVATMDELALAEPLPEDIATELDENYISEAPDATIAEPEIIRRKRIVGNPMNEAEAIEQMELLGHSFFMFFNMDANEVNVVYRRGSGGYGLLALDVE